MMGQVSVKEDDLVRSEAVRRQLGAFQMSDSQKGRNKFKFLPPLILMFGLMLLLAFPVGAQKHHQHKQHTSDGTFNLPANRKETNGSANGGKQQITSQKETKATFKLATTTATATSSVGRPIKRRDANDGPTDKSEQQQQLDDDIPPATGSSSSSSSSNNNNNNNSIGQQTNNKSQEVSELNAFEAARLGYFRHSLETSVILTIAYTIVFIVGIIGNTFVVAIVCKSPRMRTVTNYFIANLALADILVLLFCLPATLVGNIFIPYVLGQFVCKTVSWLQGVAVSASINTMVAVTLDRFLAICFPMDWHMSRRMARWTIACIWLFSISVSLPWALYFSLLPHTLPDDRIIQVCTENWPSERWGNMYFVCANLILLYLFPATVIILCYLGIWYKIERRNIPGDRPKGLKIELIMQKSKLKVVKMMMVVVVIFLLSWLPLYLIFARVKLADDRSQWEEWLINKMMPLAQWLGASNSCINPILYTFFNRKYKRGFIDLLKLSFCCCGPNCDRDRTNSRRNQQPAYSNGLTHCTTANAALTGGATRLSAPGCCTGCRQHLAKSSHQETTDQQQQQRRNSRCCCRQQPDMRMDFILPAVSSRRLDQNGALRHHLGKKRTSNTTTTTTTLNGASGSTATNQCRRASVDQINAGQMEELRLTDAGTGLAMKARGSIQMAEPIKSTKCRGERRHSGPQQQQYQTEASYCSHKEKMPSARSKVSSSSDARRRASEQLYRSSRELSESSMIEPLNEQQPARASCIISARQRPDTMEAKSICKRDNGSSSSNRSRSSRLHQNHELQACLDTRLENYRIPKQSLSQLAASETKSSKTDQSNLQKEGEKTKSSKRKMKNLLPCRGSGAVARNKSFISTTSARETTESTDLTGMAGHTCEPNLVSTVGAPHQQDAGQSAASELMPADSEICRPPANAADVDGDGDGDNLGQLDSSQIVNGDVKKSNDDDESSSRTTTGLDEDDNNDDEEEEDNENDRCTNDDDGRDDEHDQDDDGEEEGDNLLFGSASSEEGKPIRRSRRRRRQKRRQRLSLDNRDVDEHGIGQGMAASGNSFMRFIMNGLARPAAAARSDMTLSGRETTDPRRHSATNAPAATIDLTLPPPPPPLMTTATICKSSAGRQGLADCKTSIIKNCASTRTLTSNYNNNNICKQTDYNV